MHKNSGKRRFSILHFSILLLNLFFALTLLVSYLGYYTNPNTSTVLAFFGLLYPLLLVVNIIFILIWVLIKPRWVFLSLIVILLGINHVGRVIQINAIDLPKNREEQKKILSYNLQNFVKYNTTSTKYIEDFENEKQIIDFLRNQEATVYCLQEFLYDREGMKSYAEKFSKLLGCQYYYMENYYSSKSKVDAIITISRYPIIHDGHLVYEDKNIGLYTDIAFPGDTVRVYNLHLASIHFRHEDYRFIQDIGDESDRNLIIDKSKNIRDKLATAFKKRGEQVLLVTSHMSQSQYPVVVCGDFNDTPNSYAYQKISKGKSDAFVESGKGLGITFANDNFPPLRIDFILHDNELKSFGFITHEEKYSDHYPISTYLVFNQETIDKTANPD